MKQLILASLIAFSTLAIAQEKHMVGQKDQSMCGEPCEHCAGGIKQCQNTQSDNTNRDTRDVGNREATPRKKKQAVGQ